MSDTSSRVLQTIEFDDLEGLQQALTALREHAAVPNDATIFVNCEGGEFRLMNEAKLIENVLTDGSKTYDITLI